jgi:hypothetical protein
MSTISTTAMMRRPSRCRARGRDDSVEEEIAALLDDLADDQLAEAVALAWVGVGTFDSTRVGGCLRRGNDLIPTTGSRSLMNMPTLAGQSGIRPRGVRLQLRRCGAAGLRLQPLNE